MNRWGLVIQGPAISTGLQGPLKAVGQGPNVHPTGYNCLDAIRANLQAVTPDFACAVVSTWLGSGLPQSLDGDSVLVMESAEPKQDFDNRRKQFVSTARGLEYLSDRGVTHVVKIRTDQILTRDTFTWLKDRYGSCDETDGTLTVSEFLPSTPFYVGDFIIAGTLRNLSTFVSANVGYGPRNLHPSAGIDYVLKYLSRVEPEFWDQINVKIPLLPQLADPRNVPLRRYWSRVRRSYFDFLPRKHLESVTWRGVPLNTVLDIEVFGCHEDHRLPDAESARSAGAFEALHQVWSTAFQEARRHYRREGRQEVAQLLRGLQSGRYAWPTEDTQA